MNHQELFKLLKTVRKNIRCPQCGKQYNFSDIHVKSIIDFVVFLELNCDNHMPVLATVALTTKNTPSIKNKSKITYNDVIDTYKFLENFSGGFDKIFKN